MTEQEFQDIETQSAFKCYECDNMTEDQPENPSYECGNCGNAWNKANAEDGHRCTECGKFASKNNAHCCEECESTEDVEEISDYCCPQCEELIEEDEWKDHYETHLAESPEGLKQVADEIAASKQTDEVEQQVGQSQEKFDALLKSVKRDTIFGDPLTDEELKESADRWFDKFAKKERTQ